jgi:DNA-binding CsgD family transcriptional regulator
MYTKENLTAKEISLKTGFAIRTVYQHLQGIAKNNSVKRTKTGPKPKVGLEVILDMYLNQNLGIKKISEKTGLTTSTIQYHLKKNKIPKNPEVKNYKTGPNPRIMLERIVDLYINKGLTTAEAGEILNCDEKTIYDRLTRAGYSIRPRGTTVNTLLNHNYFNINNLDKKAMYWIGFIVGDGSIYGDTLSIYQRLKYKNLLTEFKNDLQISSNIYIKVSKSPNFEKTGTMCNSGTVKLTSSSIILDLKKYGIKENKSKVGGKLNINKYKNCFLLGLLDSDGWVGLSNGRYSIGWCGHEDHIIEVQKILKDDLGISLNIHKHGNIKSISTSKKIYIKRIAKYLTKDLNSLLDYKQKRLIKIREG